MFYKPSYCCHCGEKIEKPDFLPIRDSGKFCDVCRNDFPFREFMPPIVMLFCTVLGIAGIGSFLFKGDTTNELALKQNKVSTPQTLVKTEPAANLSQNSNRQTLAQTAPKNEPQSPPNANQTAPENRKTEVVKVVAEKTYYCGAETKKGTPCSRKVKGGGRCWQHQGRDAMYPPEKLLITQ